MTIALAGWIQFGARVIAGSAFFLALLVALTHWAVRAKHLGAFGAWPRFVRGWSDPLLKPLERRIVRSGWPTAAGSSLLLPWSTMASRS